MKQIDIDLELKLKTPLKTMRITHFALLGGQIIFVIVIFMMTEDARLFINTKDPFTFIVPISAINSVFIGGFLHRKILQRSKRIMNIMQAMIVRYAILEFVCFLGIIAFMLSKNYLFILISCVMIGVFACLRPTMERVKNIVMTNEKMSYKYC